MQGKTGVVFIATMLSLNVAAQPQPSWGHISNLQALEIQYKAEAGAAKARQEAIEMGARIDGYKTESKAPLSAVGIPAYLGAVGNPSRPKATFMLDGGNQVTARVGDTLLGGFKVTSITLNKVVVIDSQGKSIELLRGNASNNSNRATNQNNYLPGQNVLGPAYMQ